MQEDVVHTVEMMSWFYQLLLEYKFLFSILLLIFLLWIKRFIVKLARSRSKQKGDDRRHQINLFKQLYNASILVVLLVVWSAEAQHFAISIAAFMVGIVLALREFIQCVVGFIYYLGSRPFRVGDWIQFNNEMVGVVREIDWAKITLLEVEPHTFEYTGKHLHIPNSRLVSQTIKNLNFLKRYTLHSFDVVIQPNLNPYELLPQLLERARVHCEHFHEVAGRYKGFIERNLEVEFIEVEPQISIETNRYANMVVVVSLFCPTDEAVHIQQKITADVMALVFGRQDSKEKAKAVATDSE